MRCDAICRIIRNPKINSFKVETLRLPVANESFIFVIVLCCAVCCLLFAVGTWNTNTMRATE